LGFGYPYAHAAPRPRPDDEKSFLTEQAEYFKKVLEGINKRLDRLKSTKEDGKQS
jgi:hypothetical protein